MMPGPDLSGQAIADLIVEEKVTVAAGVPTIWMEVLPELEGSRHVQPAGDPVRRLGRAQGAVRGIPRAARPAAPAGVGDDRDQSRWRRCAARRRRGAAAGRRAGRPAHRRRADRCSVSSAASSSRTRSTPCPRDGESSGELQCRGPWIAATYYNDPRAARASPTTAGCAPATSPRWTSGAGSASSIAPRT